MNMPVQFKEEIIREHGITMLKEMQKFVDEHKGSVRMEPYKNHNRTYVMQSQVKFGADQMLEGYPHQITVRATFKRGTGILLDNTLEVVPFKSTQEEQEVYMVTKLTTPKEVVLNGHDDTETGGTH